MQVDFSFLNDISLGSVTIYTLLPAIIVLGICLLLIKLAMNIVNKMLERSHIEKSLHTFLKTAVRIALYTLTALIVADKLGIPITSLVAALSIFGLAISLAVQNSLSNLAGGIMLLVSKPFVVGDYVEAGGVSGTVSEIGLAYTKIVTVDNKVIHCPNSEISAAKIINYTLEKSRRVDISIGASYDAPVKDVIAALLSCAAKHGAVMTPDKEPFAAVTEYMDSCIQYTLRVWVNTEAYWDVYFALLQQIKEEFDARSIEMTYPHMNVHIVQK